MEEIDVTKVEASMAAKKAQDMSTLVLDKNKDRQRELASQTLGKKVFDIIELDDKFGDPALVWVYADANTRDLAPNQTVIAMVLWPSPTCHPSFGSKEGSSCTKLGILFEELKFAQGSLWDSQGNNFLQTIQAGGYPY